MSAALTDRITYDDPRIDDPLHGCIEPGMIICLESYNGSELSGQGVKLEDQVLITEDGYENLTRYPFESRLLK